MAIFHLNAADTEKLNKHFFEVLNPALMPKDYQAAIKKNDLQKALKTAIRYFRKRPTPAFFDNLNKRSFNAKTAEDAAKGKITVVNIPHQFPDGKIDFLYDPTRKTGIHNPEWQWQINRMYFWNDMAIAYRKSKDEMWAVSFAQQVHHWVTNVPQPDSGWNKSGSAWRTIETGLRLMGSWQLAFEIFRKSPSVPDETLALMLASMHEQTCHAMAHRTSQNWLLMELCGVYTFAALFPEFKDAEKFRRQSAKIFGAEIKKQLLPDGMQNELSPDYHSVTFNCAKIFYNIARLADRLDELPPDFGTNVELAADAYLQLMTPAFVMPRTNDCFTMDVTDRLKTAYEFFPHRKDFLWGGTRGEKGKKPTGKTASRFLPWAGFAAMRSSWDADAAYLCFDVGPLGMNHIHQDKLNINIWKGDEELLYDDGGGQYEDSVHRRYGISAAAHNTILVDGEGQNRISPKKVSRPINASYFSNENFDYAQGLYNDTFGAKRLKPASHRREVLFVKPDFFAVADTMRSSDEKSHDYTMLLQMDTLNVQHGAGFVRGILNGKYDLYALLLSEDLSITVKSGSTDPVSGWYVGRNDKDLHPASTVRITAEAKKDFRFLTLFFPLKKGDQPPRAEKLSASHWQIIFNGKSYQLDLKDLQKNFRTQK